MNQINLHINHHVVTLYTNIDSVKDCFQNQPQKITKTIPITEITIIETDHIKEDKNFLYLADAENKWMRFNKEKNIAWLSCPKESLRIPDLVYILLGMFSNLLKEENQYLVHSSVLKYDQEHSMMLIGEANSGKTSLAYNLIRNHHCNLISNDHAIVGFEDNHIKTYGGTKELELRGGIIKALFPELKKYLKENQDDLWDQKIIVNDFLQEEGHHYENESIITDIFQISTVDKAATFIRKKDKIDQLLYLYEQFSKNIKNGYGLITGFGYPLPSVETEDSMQYLYKSINQSLPNTEVHLAKGNIDDLAKEMVKQLWKRKSS